MTEDRTQVAYTTAFLSLWISNTATLSASYAFMLPVATPTNTIVFGSDRAPMQAMVIRGKKGIRFPSFDTIGLSIGM